MNKDAYLTELQEAIINAGYKQKYIDLCLKYANILLSNDMPVIFDTIHAALLFGIDGFELGKMLTCDQYYYKLQQIPKKNGGVRDLHIPAKKLKEIQRWILDNILVHMNVSPYAMGFYPQRSIVTNAIQHINQECIINIDIEDFFPSITFERIFRVFYYYGYTKEVSFVLSKLCTYLGKLPQGSPASPYLSNIISLKLDKRLSQLAKTKGVRFSRYADDITFSGPRSIQHILPIVEEIVQDEGFRLNKNKTRILFKHECQEVTGLVVNNGQARVKRSYKRAFMQELYYCKKFGVSEHLKHLNCNKSYYKEHVYGKAYFIMMVEPEYGLNIIKLLDEIEWEY